MSIAITITVLTPLVLALSLLPYYSLNPSRTLQHSIHYDTATTATEVEATDSNQKLESNLEFVWRPF